MTPEYDYDALRAAMIDLARAESAWTPASQCANCGNINHLVSFGRPCPVCGVDTIDTTAREVPQPTLATPPGPYRHPVTPAAACTPEPDMPPNNKAASTLS